jgi:hypothetical protein
MIKEAITIHLTNKCSIFTFAGLSHDSFHSSA